MHISKIYSSFVYGLIYKIKKTALYNLIFTDGLHRQEGPFKNVNSDSPQVKKLMTNAGSVFLKILIVRTSCFHPIYFHPDGSWTEFVQSSTLVLTRYWGALTYDSNLRSRDKTRATPHTRRPPRVGHCSVPRQSPTPTGRQGRRSGRLVFGGGGGVKKKKIKPPKSPPPPPRLSLGQYGQQLGLQSRQWGAIGELRLLRAFGEFDS